jgi:arylsulfatase A
MFRREFLKAAVLGATASVLAGTVRKQARKPNIILIMADDLGYECLGCNGGLSYKTPILDRLAESGVRFTHAHAQPLCTPTRVQIMTGKYNFRNYTQFGALKPGEYTFGHLLQDAGYKTCVVGKWQLAGRVKRDEKPVKGTMPRKAGFDEHCLWQIKFKGTRYWRPSVNTNGTLRKDIDDKYGPDVFCDYSLDFIDRHAEQPFFLYFPMALTHNPFIPSPDSDDADEARSAKSWKSDSRYFADEVEYMDKIVGRILDKVESLGLGEQTLIIFTGDNGTNSQIVSETVNGSIRGAKGRTIKAGTHVPLIVRWSGVTPRGKVNDDLVDFADFFPTFAQVAGAKVPADYPWDGVSFLPQIKGEIGKPRDWIFTHYEPKWGKWKKARYVMDKRYKLYEDGRFFDTDNDALEEHSMDQKDAGIQRIEAEFRKVLKSIN